GIHRPAGHPRGALMPFLDDFRKQYPDYNDLDDTTLAKALHGKFYADMPFREFSNRIGFTPPTPRLDEWGQPVAEYGLAAKEPREYQIAMLGEMGKGVPILGGLVPQSEAMTRMEREHTGLATAFNIGGGVASMVPAVAAAPEILGARAVPWL